MLTIAFTGDVRFRLRPGDPEPEQVQFDSEIVDALHRSDYAVFNIEGPITESPPHKTIGAVVQNSPAFLPVLKRLHCNVFNLGNNHVFDHGLPGFHDTIEAARRHGWQWMGAGETIEQASKPLILENGDVKVGLISVCHPEGPLAGTNAPGIFSHTMIRLIRRRLQAIKRQCDHVGVVYHGGEELYRLPMPSRRKRLLGYLDAGADFVVAHHAHVVQGYEDVGGKLVFYGLGNFAFDPERLRPHPSIDESALVCMRFEKGRRPDYDVIFTRHDRPNRHIRLISRNAWFWNVSAKEYSSEYGSYARQILREWMVVPGNPHPGLLRRLRRITGIALGLKHIYRRPLVIAGVKQAIAELLGGKPNRRIMEAIQSSGG